MVHVPTRQRFLKFIYITLRNHLPPGEDPVYSAPVRPDHRRKYPMAPSVYRFMSLPTHRPSPSRSL